MKGRTERLIALGIAVVLAIGSFAFLVAVRPETGDGRHSGSATERSYDVKELVYMGATHTFSYLGFNDKAHIAGSLWGDKGKYVAALYDGSKLTQIGTLPGDDGSRVYGMNENDMVVGASYKYDRAYALRTTHAFKWRDGKIEQLPAVGGLPFSRAWAVNSAGVVVGNSYRPLNDARDAASLAVLWRDRQAFPLAMPPGAEMTYAVAINDAGQVAGNAWMKDGTRRACRWDDGKPTLLPPQPGHGSTTAASINARGEILAASLATDAKGGPPKILVWSSTGTRVIGGIPGVSQLEPVRINDSGTIVVQDPETPGYPFLWTPDSGFTRVSRLIGAGTGYSLWKAMGLNNRGQIAVGGRYAGTRASVYLLSPRSTRTQG